LGDDCRVESQPRPAAEAEAHDTELVGVRVHPAAIDAEPGGDLAGREQATLARFAAATQQLGDLVRDGFDGGWIERRAHTLQVGREAG